MLNPRKLNILAGSKIDEINYPLSWSGGGAAYVALAWQQRKLNSEQWEMVKGIGIDVNVPFAFPATYLDHRMIAQRSCFTIHGNSLDPIEVNILRKEVDIKEYLFEYPINANETDTILKQLSVIGVSGGSLFPDLDHLAYDLVFDVRNRQFGIGVYDWDTPPSASVS